MPLDFETKICEPEHFRERVELLPKPRVFTNGVFDILHRGHVSYLAEARAKGESLIVALNSDTSAKRLGKGEDRPVNTLHDRMAVVAALHCVDLVTWFEADTPLELILACRPEVLVKGGDWKPEAMVGAKEGWGWGGSVLSIPFRHEQSPSSLLERIRRKPR